MSGVVLASGLALGMLGLGGAACVLPGPTSALYGVPREDRGGQAWVRAAGLRDLALAGVLAGLLIDDDLRAAGLVCVATACVAIADATNVTVVRGPRLLPLSVHASGVVVGLAGGIALWAAGRRAP